MPAITFGASKLTNCLVVNTVQLFSCSFLARWQVFLWKVINCGCNACKKHVFVDKKQNEFWSLPMCSNQCWIIFLPVCPVDNFSSTKTTHISHHHPLFLFMLFVDFTFFPRWSCFLKKGVEGGKSFKKRKVKLKQTHFHGLNERCCTYFVHV